jgi:hypothetical protein
MSVILPALGVSAAPLHSRRRAELMNFRVRRWVAAVGLTILTVTAGAVVNPEAASASTDNLTAWSSDHGAYGTLYMVDRLMHMTACDKKADGHHALTQFEAWNGTIWHVFLDEYDGNGTCTEASEDAYLPCNGRVRIRVAVMEGNITISQGWSIYVTHSGALFSCF